MYLVKHIETSMIAFIILKNKIKLRLKLCYESYKQINNKKGKA